MNSLWRWRCMQRPITLPSSTLRGGEQGGGAMPFVIVGHGLTAGGLDRQTRLAAVEGLYLALLVEREHDGVGRRIDIEADDVDELGGKAGISRVLEGTQPMRLQFVRPPDALYRAQRDANGFGHRPAGPMDRLVRRFGAGQRHHPRRGFRGNRRLAGPADLVAQQTFNPDLGKALLPAPHGSAG